MKFYLVLTKPKTLVSKYLAKHFKYTHSSISLTKNLSEVYSYARKYSFFFYPGIAKREDFRTKVFLNSPLVVIELTSQEDIKALVQEITSEYPKYDFLNIFRHQLGLKPKKRKKLYCSSFVSLLLNKLGLSDKDYLQVSPDDLYHDFKEKIIYLGNVNDYLKDEV